MNAINFKNRKKEFFTVTLPDDTVLILSTPSKKIMNRLISLKAVFDNFNENEGDTGIIDELYEACALVMSRNKTGKIITNEYLEETFDFDDILYFFEEYMNFVVEVADTKN